MAKLANHYIYGWCMENSDGTLNCFLDSVPLPNLISMKAYYQGYLQKHISDMSEDYANGLKAQIAVLESYIAMKVPPGEIKAEEAPANVGTSDSGATPPSAEQVVDETDGGRLNAPLPNSIEQFGFTILAHNDNRRALVDTRIEAAILRAHERAELIRLIQRNMYFNSETAIFASRVVTEKDFHYCTVCCSASGKWALYDTAGKHINLTSNDFDAVVTALMARWH